MNDGTQTASPGAAPPKIEAEARSLSSSRAFAPLAILAATALIMTVVNLMATVYLYRAKSDLAALDDRLEELSAFERRFQAKIDSVNNGLQNQFDQLNRNLQGQFNEVAGRLDRQDRALQGLAERPAMAGGFGAFPPQAGLSGAPAEPPPVLAEELPEAPPLAPVARTVRQPAPPPKPSSSYQRLESPDGKVYYKKIRKGP